MDGRGYPNRISYIPWGEEREVGDQKRRLPHQNKRAAIGPNFRAFSLPAKTQFYGQGIILLSLLIDRLNLNFVQNY